MTLASKSVQKFQRGDVKKLLSKQIPPFYRYLWSIITVPIVINNWLPVYELNQINKLSTTKVTQK